MIEIIALAVFAGLLIYAACSDVARLLIPNWVSIALTAAFPVVALAVGMPLAEIGLHFLFGVGVLVVGFFLFQGGVIGGGDAKLLAATAVWTGFPAFAPFALGTVLAGGLIAVVLLLARRVFKQAESLPSFVNRLLTPRSGVPYGVAIMIGGLLATPALSYLTGPLTLP